MFDLTRPCITCPFRKGQGPRFQLSPQRLREIKRGEAFQCHMTINYDAFDDPVLRQGKHPQQCAGLMAVLLRDGCANTIMQVAERIGGIDFSGIDPRHEAYKNWAAVLAAHKVKP